MNLVDIRQKAAAQIASDFPLHPKKKKKKKIKMTQEVEIEKVTIEPSTGSVFLHEKHGERILQIVMEPYQASVLDLCFRRENFVRPLTHDLVHTMMELGDLSLEKIVVDEVKNSVIMSTLYIKIDGEMNKVDARPSDALIMAAREIATIFVSETVMDMLGFVLKSKTKVHNCGETKEE